MLKANVGDKIFIEGSEYEVKYLREFKPQVPLHAVHYSRSGGVREVLNWQLQAACKIDTKIFMDNLFNIYVNYKPSRSSDYTLLLFDKQRGYFKQAGVETTNKGTPSLIEAESLLNGYTFADEDLSNKKDLIRELTEIAVPITTKVNFPNRPQIKGVIYHPLVALNSLTLGKLEGVSYAKMYVCKRAGFDGSHFNVSKSPGAHKVGLFEVPKEFEIDNLYTTDSQVEGWFSGIDKFIEKAIEYNEKYFIDYVIARDKYFSTFMEAIK